MNDRTDTGTTTGTDTSTTTGTDTDTVNTVADTTNTDTGNGEVVP